MVELMRPWSVFLLKCRWLEFVDRKWEQAYMLVFALQSLYNIDTYELVKCSQYRSSANSLFGVGMFFSWATAKIYITLNRQIAIEWDVVETLEQICLFWESLQPYQSEANATHWCRTNVTGCR